MAAVTSLPNKCIELLQLPIQSGRKDFAQLEADEVLSPVRDQEDFRNPCSVEPDIEPAHIMQQGA
jgi:hypothetical protein